MCDKETKLNFAIVLIAMTLCTAGVSWSAPIGTAFTYQGFLQYTGGGGSRPEDGLFDFRFSLYDDPNTGTQLGSTIAINDYDVIEGNVEIKLDFGPDPNRFNGDARWLEIAVRPGASSDPCDLVTLSPRQEITPTPYALYALESGTGSGGDSDWTIMGNDMYSAVSGNVGIGDETPSDKLDVEGHINSSETYKLGGSTVLSNEGDYNIFVGQGAGALNTSQHNSAVGYLALQSNTDGQGNSAMGSNALKSNTTGERNTAMGNYALSLNDTGQSNTGIGSWALQYNTSGIYNSAVGSWALGYNTTGNYNSAMGVSALSLNTIGTYNTAVGYGALLENNEGNVNAAVGSYALRSNLTGSGNSAIGDHTLYYNTTGRQNTAVGAQALFTNTTGEYNTAIGNLANYYNQNGSRNTMLGHGAGRGDGVHDKSGNVFIGYQAGFFETGSNRLYIENSNSSSPLIYGEFDNDLVAINGQLQITGGSPGDGKVLVSDATGLANWQDPVAGSDSDWTVSADDLYSAVSGNVGIGDNTPDDKLDVAGSINATETYKLGGTTVLSNPGTQNIFVGKDAGYSNTTGQQNSAVGNRALYANTTGDFNTALGYGVLQMNDEGSLNSGVGYGALISNTTGNRNTAMGDHALGDNTIGVENTAVGGSALSHNTEGHYNSAVGKGALLNNTTGQYNSAVGHEALAANTTGSHNSAMGYGALESNTGSNNTGMGYGVLAQNTTGQYNSAMGASALISNTTGSNNTAMGYYSLFSNKTGHSNLAIGSYALRYATGSQNSAVGSNALCYNTMGQNNTALGFHALFHNKTGNYNTAVGSVALYDCNDGDFNSAVGYGALFECTEGNSNTAMGYNALRYNTTASNNSALGYGAMNYNTTGNSNSATGSYALFQNTTGSYNSAMGRGALSYNTEGQYNSAVGYESLFLNNTGNSNTAIGHSALRFNTTGSYNVSLGGYANYYNQEGSNNTIIGYEAGRGTSVHSKSGNVFIGYQAGYNETGSNKLYIANSDVNPPLIYGDFSTGNVGLGTTTPLAYMHIERSTQSNNQFIRIQPTDVSQIPKITFRAMDGTEAMSICANSTGARVDGVGSAPLYLGAGGFVRATITAGGNVGIGTTSPAYDLDVNGDIRAIGSVYYGGTEGNANATLYNKPDYVFEEGYDVMNIEQVEQYLKKENHLPWMTSAKQEKEENGDVIDMTRMAFETVETAENLQIQIIELKKRNEALEKRIAALEKMIVHQQFVSEKEVQ